MSRTSKSDVRAAVDRAHRSEAERLDPETERTLQRELDRVWTKIQGQPNSYTMDKLEFSVFNRYRSERRFQNETARKAIERYWNSTVSADGH